MMKKKPWADGTHTQVLYKFPGLLFFYTKIFIIVGSSNFSGSDFYRQNYESRKPI